MEYTREIDDEGTSGEYKYWNHTIYIKHSDPPAVHYVQSPSGMYENRDDDEPQTGVNMVRMRSSRPAEEVEPILLETLRTMLENNIMRDLADIEKAQKSVTNMKYVLNSQLYRKEKIGRVLGEL